MGSRVDVLWYGGDWYAGTLGDFNNITGLCQVQYDDGDMKWHDLSLDTWRPHIAPTPSSVVAALMVEAPSQEEEDRGVEGLSQLTEEGQRVDPAVLDVGATELAEEKAAAMEAAAATMNTEEVGGGVYVGVGATELAEEEAVEMEAAAATMNTEGAGGEALEMCSDGNGHSAAARIPASRGSLVVDAAGCINLQPLARAETEFPDLWQWKTASSGQLWRSLYGWMSGVSGITLYLQLQILVKSSDVWFHAHHWAIGVDQTPRLLQEDGSFASLPAGRRACQLPHFSVVLLLSLLQASESCETMFAEEFTTAGEMLPSEISKELQSRPRKAYTVAIKKYVKHAITYQLLPWSLARTTEESGPVFLRALLTTFFPEQANRASVCVVVEPGGELSMYHAALQDLTDATKVMEYLATSVDTNELQLCHERLLEMSVASHADTQYKAVISVRQWQNQADKEREKLKRAKSIGDLDKRAARAARDKALEKRQCFSLGFIEMCEDETFLKQVIRVAQTGLTIGGHVMPAIKWGKKCCCLLPMHQADCWQRASMIYKFNSDHFFHLYVHQMLAEGVFNMHDHNQMNVTADFKKAAVNMKVDNRMRERDKIREREAKSEREREREWFDAHLVNPKIEYDEFLKILTV
jgi:hypothetical protein